MTLKEVLNLKIRELERGSRLFSLLNLRKDLHKEIKAKVRYYQDRVENPHKFLADDIDWMTRIDAFDEITRFITQQYPLETIRRVIAENRK